MRQYALVLAMLLAPLGANAQTYMPYPEADITLDQWESYHNLVRACCESTQRIDSQRQVVSYQRDEGRLNFTFTLKGHPAHPAWITREVIPGEEVQMQLAGYFAGDEAAFAKLFEAYSELTDHMMRVIRERKQAAATEAD